MIDRYSRPEMKALWTEEAKYASWATVEKAHLETLIERGEAPPAALDAFLKATNPLRIDDYLRREQETGHDVIAFIAEVGSRMGDQGRHLHRGLTSSDVLDSSLALRLVETRDVLLEGLRGVRTALAEQAFAHAATPCIGRTHGIHAEPLSFGQVLAGHFAEFQRVHHDFLALGPTLRAAKLSGAVGSYSQLAPDFEAAVLTRLGLEPETVATQVVPRDRLLRFAQVCERAAGAIERFAVNLRHWARTELGEVLEPFSSRQKGSSAMPHKRNPILSENLSGLSRVIRGYVSMLGESTALWHERDISHSSVERMALPDMCVTLDFMLHRTASLARDMQVRPDVMEANLHRTGGLWCSQSVLTALVEGGMNRTEAYELVQRIALPLAASASLGAAPRDAFLTALLAERRVTDVVGPENLRSLFDLGRFLAPAAVTFRRAFGMVPEEWERKSNQRGGAKPTGDVPALQTVWRVSVELLPDVLDTEAKTIESDFRHAGGTPLAVRQRREFLIRTASPAAAHRTAVENYARDVLHNAVIERVRIEVEQ